MKITAPVPQYSGVVAGVSFVDGVGSTDDANAIGYFRRHGYSLSDASSAEDPVDEPEPEVDDGEPGDEPEPEVDDGEPGDEPEPKVDESAVKKTAARKRS